MPLPECSLHIVTSFRRVQDRGGAGGSVNLKQSYKQYLSQVVKFNTDSDTTLTARILSTT